MPFEVAVRLIELGLALAVIQRGAEHLGRDPKVFLPQILLAFWLLTGMGSGVVLIGLWGMCAVQLYRFQGPYNGAADKMAMLIVTCLCAAHWAPTAFWSELALAYLAVQVVLSYVVSGWVKLRNPDWRSGQALIDVFAFSTYPVSDAMRMWASKERVLTLGAWGVIGFEVAFPLGLLHPSLLLGMLGIAAAFHLANAICFGLNRFLWIWVSAYPALIWLQALVVAPA